MIWTDLCCTEARSLFLPVSANAGRGHAPGRLRAFALGAMPGFNAISNDVANLGELPYFVYCAMARGAAGSDGFNGLRKHECQISARDIGRQLRLPATTVQRAFKTLENAGHALVQRRATNGSRSIVYLLPGLDIEDGVGHARVTSGSSVGSPNNTHLDTHPDPSSNSHKNFALTAPPSNNGNRPTEQERDVLLHYQQVHPRRRVIQNGHVTSRKFVTTVRRALKSFSPEELKRAIDGNARDPWHQERRKHELTYVLRDPDKISGFIDRPIDQEDLLAQIQDVTKGIL